MKRTGHKLRLPVRIVDGMIEFEYGGRLPLRQNAVAEMVVDAGDVDDPDFLDRVSKRRTVKLLPQGTPLLVMMSSNRPFDLRPEISKAAMPFGEVFPKLGKWFHGRYRPSEPFFVPISIGPLLPWQVSPDQGTTGGLWLDLQGAQPIGMISSQILLPAQIKADHIKSLNHAFTVLSEHFEPQRISHTGNVYEQVLYNESNGLWYPLKLFRDGEIADEEHTLALAFWDRLKAQMQKPSEQG